MNKHAIIVIVASVVIVASIGFSVWNIFSADYVQFKAVEQNFSYFDLMNNGKISMCNPLPFSASFNNVKISMIFDGRNTGVLDMSDVYLEPNMETKIQGKFTSETAKEAQYLSLHFDSMYNNVIPTRIDQEKMNVVTEIQTKIIGIIPYSITNQHSGLEFWKMMEDVNNEYSC
jgi:hypothetical protein